MNGIASFFKQYDGRRINVADSQPIERGMTTEDLRDWLTRYDEMVASGVRPGGAPFTPREVNEIATQSARLRAELKRRGQS